MKCISLYKKSQRKLKTKKYCDKIYSNNNLHLLDFETLNYILIKIKKQNNVKISIIAIIQDDSESSRQYNKGRKN